MKKIFKNRMIQESEDTMRKLRSTYINMHEDKKNTPNTPDGLFFISFQPNSKVDEPQLESDYGRILCYYYRWMFGTRWVKKYQSKQFDWRGLIELQDGYHYHIHYIMESYNIEELAIFLGYTSTLFKQLYPKASFDFQRVYDIDGCKGYVDPNPSVKDTYKSKRRLETYYICSQMYQKKKY